MEHLTGTAITFGYLVMVLFLIPRMKFFRIGSIPIRWFQGVFVLKVLSGFLLYLVYTYYYKDRSTADIWKYYDDGMVMFSALHENPLDYLKMLFGLANDGGEFAAYYNRMNHWYRPYGSSIANDTHTIIRFNAFVRLFSLGYYNVHSVVVNFLGLIGLTGIFHFLRQMAPAKEKWFFAAVFLMPGMMFWASGVLKEPLLLFGLGMFLFGVMRIVKDGLGWSDAVLLVLGLMLLTTVKSYALAAVALGIIAWILSRKWETIQPFWFFFAVFGVGFMGVMLIHQLFPEKSLFTKMAQRQHEFYQLAQGGTYILTADGDSLYINAAEYDKLEFVNDRKQLVLAEGLTAVYWSDANEETEDRFELQPKTEYDVLLDYGRTGSTIDIPKLDSNAWSVIKAVPAALMNALFRPFPWNIRSPFMLLSGMENMLIALLLLAMLFWFDKAVFSDPIFWLALSFAISILVLTGLVTPVVGAIVRYKVPALPFLACALLAATDTKAVEQFLLHRLPFFKRYF